MLLSSGKLRILKLCFPVFFTDICMVLPQMLTEKGCLSIKVLELDRNFQNDDSEWLENLLQNVKFSGSLSVRALFNPLALKNYKRLKSLEVIQIFWNQKEFSKFLSEAADTLSHLEDLEEFDVFEYTAKSSTFLTVVKMLDNHPKLASLRFTDSSRAALHIDENHTGHELPKYGLRKCSWTYDTSPYEDITALNISFLQRIRSSVLLFPLVEELEILVHSEDCFECLKKLKHLRSLKMTFHIDSTYQGNFSFLSGIGQQLRHLCIITYKEVLVNAISKYCFNLEYLKIIVSATIWDSIESSYSFKRLKRLEIFKIDANSLLYVFQNVRNLKELQFYNATVLDDQRLLEILDINPLAFYHLDIVFVRNCMLSREGFRIFLEHAVKLTKAYIKSRHFSEDEEVDFSDVIKEWHRQKVWILKLDSFITPNHLGIFIFLKYFNCFIHFRNCFLISLFTSSSHDSFGLPSGLATKS
ncbi:uncharacterized protein CDAR_523831 [Caerostris darwini]|uniref:Uncharacterized protein n=1 Tax=Caerostris darwini TaxID=1538125 RepID=A0AAV4TRJ0_9ARAC|nr:uncharacterized protein CDAR_523831 [Caerostris darwini]